jgi:hypothetical protein
MLGLGRRLAHSTNRWTVTGFEFHPLRHAIPVFCDFLAVLDFQYTTWSTSASLAPSAWDNATIFAKRPTRSPQGRPGWIRLSGLFCRWVNSI